MKKSKKQYVNIDKDNDKILSIKEVLLLMTYLK